MSSLQGWTSSTNAIGLVALDIHGYEQYRRYFSILMSLTLIVQTPHPCVHDPAPAALADQQAICDQPLSRHRHINWTSSSVISYDP